MWFKEEGYLPEAVRNFLQLLGYAGDDAAGEVRTFDEFIADFAWEKVNTVGPVFDLTKLDWLNGHYIRTLAADELADRIVEWAKEYGQWEDSMSVDVLSKAVPIIQERLTLLKDALPQLDYLFGDVEVEESAKASLKEDAGNVLDEAVAVLESVEMDAESIQAALKERLVEGLGIKPRFAFAPLRIAVSGRKVSPPLFESIEILGREETIKRFKALRSQL